MGNKKKLINKGLINLFPKNINTFYDLFAGSAIVSMNVKANKYIVNDIDTNLYRLYHMFKYTNSNEIISHINKRIDEYGLARERTKRNEFKDKQKIEQYKSAYFKFRDTYNLNIEYADTKDFYTLMFYSFSQQFRFNKKGKFNMPCGNDCFSKTNETYIKNGCDFFNSSDTVISNTYYTALKPYILNSETFYDDFVYLDPPYLNTTATYTENCGWTTSDEEELYLFCEELNSHNVKFALSNVFENKCIINDKLIKWCNDNNWNVYTFDKFTYMACGKGNSKAKEVLITNYKE